MEHDVNCFIQLDRATFDLKSTYDYIETEETNEYK